MKLQCVFLHPLARFVSSSKQYPMKKNRNGINELMPCLANNVIIFKNNSTNPLSINVGPFFPFHPLHFHLSHSFQLVPRMKKIIIYTRKLVLGKMNGGMHKKEACIVK